MSFTLDIEPGGRDHMLPSMPSLTRPTITASPTVPRVEGLEAMLLSHHFRPRCLRTMQCHVSRARLPWRDQGEDSQCTPPQAVPSAGSYREAGTRETGRVRKASLAIVLLRPLGLGKMTFNQVKMLVWLQAGPWGGGCR